MRTLGFALICLATGGLLAQDVSRLPVWAREAAALAGKEAPPLGEEEAWVLLKRVVFVYLGDGRIQRQTFRLVKVLGQRGLDQGFAWAEQNGRAMVVKSLKGWNLRPDGELVKLGSQDAILLNPDDLRTSTTGTVKLAALERVTVGSLVAFERQETYQLPFGPWGGLDVLERHAVHRFEVAFSAGEGRSAAAPPVEGKLEARHWAEWGLVPMPLPGGGLAANDLPALPRDEAGLPFLKSVLARVDLRFLDAGLKEGPSLADWDDYASCQAAVFHKAAQPSGLIAVQDLAPRQALTRILDWMNRNLTYKITYLSPDRGWVPQAGPEVVRRRNGDCKDHAVCLLGEAAGAGLEGYPVLCSIQDGLVEAEASPSPMFNHAIAAIKLPVSLGLPAEVETPQGRFLLVDATDRFCPFGMLPSDHRGRRVLICLPGKALWVEVPPGAAMVPALRVEVAGELVGQGQTRARIRILETANARGLRGAALEQGAAVLRDRSLRTWFDLPATGTVSDLVLGDPLDLEHPFEVTFTVTRPGGCALGHGVFHVDAWGLPQVPEPIQKPGVPRRYPVAVRASEVLDYHASWSLPQALKPAVPALDAENPFCDLHWRAGAEGGKLTLDLALRHKDAHFDWDQREAGVIAWKRFRQMMTQLNADGRDFKLQSP